MIRSEMRETVRLLVGETIEDSIKDTEINTQLNVAQLRITSDLLCLRHHADLTTTAYNDPLLDPLDPDHIPLIEGRYGFPDDFLSLKDVEVLIDDVWRPLTEWTYDEYKMGARSRTGGPPLYYKVEFGAVALDNPSPGDIWLYPLPDQVYTVRLAYYQKPSPMGDDNDTSELPESTHLAVCYHAAMIVSRKNKDRGLIAEMSALWAQEMDNARRMVARSNQSGSINYRDYYEGY